MLLEAIGIPIAIGVQGDKYRKEFRKQANLYRASFEKLADNLEPALKPLLNEAGTALSWTKVAACSVAFSHAAVGLATLVNVYTGIKAQQELTKYYAKLGHDIEAIKNSLESISADIAKLVAHKAQHEFGEHVYDYVKMRRDRLSFAPGEHLLFIYTPGNEWHGKFSTLNNAAPIGQLCGMFDDLDVMAAFLQVVRKIVGPEPTFHILMPAIEIQATLDPTSWPDEIQPMMFEGEKCNANGLPYVNLNIPGAPSEMFLDVKNLADETNETPSPKPSIWRKVASTAAAWGTGLPAAVITTPGGMIAGLVGCAVLAPAAAPSALVCGIVCGTGVVAGSAAGTITGLFVGKKVEECWDRPAPE